MKTLLKKSICLLLVVCLSCIMITPVSAKSLPKSVTSTLPDDFHLEIIRADHLSELSFVQLQEASKLATDDATATIIFDELLKRMLNSQIPYSVATNYLVDNYVEITDYSQTSNKLTIDYTVKAKIPSGAAVFVGYQYPDSTRANGESTSLSSKSVGSYSVTYSAVSEIIARRVYSSLSARDYQETHPYGTIYGATSVVIDHHKITTAEAVSSYLINSLAPGLVARLFLPSKTLEIVKCIVSAGGTAVSILTAANIELGVPAPVAGQYYETRTWYSNNKLYIRVKVWRDKESFDTGERALYDSYNYAAATLPDF